MKYESRLRTKIRHCLLAGVATAVAVIAAPIQPASACSPPSGYSVVGAGQTIRDVPVDGPLSVMLRSYSGLPEIDSSQVTVTDESGAEITGEVAVTLGRLLWSPDAPLAADAVYQLSIDDGWSEFLYVFETTASGPPVLDNILVVDSSLEEVRRDEGVVCCDPATENSCGYFDWNHCWAERFEYDRVWQLAWEPSAGENFVLFVEYELTSDTAARIEYNEWSVGGAREARITFPEGTSDYCVTVTAYDHFVEREAVQVLCADPDTLETIPHSQPEAINATLCAGPLIDIATGMEVEAPSPPEPPTPPGEPSNPETPDGPDESAPGDGGGCAATSPTSGGWLLLLSLAALWTARRRRRVWS
ncbi:MAG: hypothetical protein Tsb0020_00100 [Haliangiales bacterium]